MAAEAQVLKKPGCRQENRGWVCLVSILQVHGHMPGSRLKNSNVAEMNPKKYIPSNITTRNHAWATDQARSNVSTYASVKIWANHDIKLLRPGYHLVGLFCRKSKPAWQCCLQSSLRTLNLSMHIRFVRPLERFSKKGHQ